VGWEGEKDKITLYAFEKQINLLVMHMPKLSNNCYSKLVDT